MAVLHGDFAAALLGVLDVSAAREFLVDFLAGLCALGVGGAPAVVAGDACTLAGALEEGLAASQVGPATAGGRTPMLGAHLVHPCVAFAAGDLAAVAAALAFPGEVPTTAAFPGGVGLADFGPAHEVFALHLLLLLDLGALAFPANVATASCTGASGAFRAFATGFPPGVAPAAVAP